MSHQRYPQNVSWNVDVEQEMSFSQDLLSGTSQSIIASGLPVNQYSYEPVQRQPSNLYQSQPWMVPSSSSSSTRSLKQMNANARRVRHVSSPLKSTSGVSRAPVDGLMIHVEKRARNGGLISQVPLPTCQPILSSPTSRRPTNASSMSRASSQSFAHDEVQSTAASNGPITPNISPNQSAPVGLSKPNMTESMYTTETGLMGTFGAGSFDQTAMSQVPLFDEQQSGLWSMANTLPQQTTNYGFYSFPTHYGMPYQEPTLYSTDDRGFTDQYLGYRRNFTVPEQLKTSGSKKPARKHFTPEVTNTLKTWFKENSHRPYPSEEMKLELLRQTGLTMNQLSNWFINARRRNWRRTRLARDG